VSLKAIIYSLGVLSAEKCARQLWLALSQAWLEPHLHPAKGSQGHSPIKMCAVVNAKVLQQPYAVYMDGCQNFGKAPQR
jgi:hypothetical protein